MTTTIDSKQVLCEMLTKMIKLDNRLNTTLITMDVKNLEEASHKALHLAQKLGMDEIVTNYKAMKPKTTTVNCKRCGGEGRSERWEATGKTCYECKGSGVETVTLPTWKKRMASLADKTIDYMNHYSVEINFKESSIKYRYGLTADQAKKETNNKNWKYYSKSGKLPNGKDLILSAWYDTNYCNTVLMGKEAFEMKKFVDLVFEIRNNMIKETESSIQGIDGVERIKEMLETLKEENKKMLEKLNY